MIFHPDWPVQDVLSGFRDVRITEIQKMEDRRTGGNTKFAVADHAADAWDALDLTDLTPLAEWIKTHATVTGEVGVPSQNKDAMKLLHSLNLRHEKAAVRLRELAASRSGDSNTQEQVFNLLERWYVLGKPAAARNKVSPDSSGGD